MTNVVPFRGTVSSSGSADFNANKKISFYAETWDYIEFAITAVTRSTTSVGSIPTTAYGNVAVCVDYNYGSDTYFYGTSVDHAPGTYCRGTAAGGQVSPYYHVGQGLPTWVVPATIRITSVLPDVEHTYSGSSTNGITGGYIIITN